jgi:hypothetical protein
MSTTQLTPLEPGHRIQLPADWAEALGLRGLVALERTTEGILIRPGPPKAWDDFFATKLQVGSAPAPQNEDIVEVSGDDILF